ncbi:MAG: hypothetical protein IAF08_05140, partial [Rhizobacter sp.]|nr:hypothetical protein [Chlorobiales bacterium]
VIVGWSVALLLTLASSFRRREREGWNTLAASVGIWFTVDSTYSLISGFWQNAVFNVVFFVCFAIPLAATYSHFEKKVEQK